MDKRTRSKSVYSEDASKKWCHDCKKFLELSDFPKKGSYCNKCVSIRNSERKNNLKYSIKCISCEKSFNSHRADAKVCSKKCRSARAFHNRMSKSYNSLPNHLLDSVGSEYRFPYDYYEKYTK